METPEPVHMCSTAPPAFASLSCVGTPAGAAPPLQVPEPQRAEKAKKKRKKKSSYNDIMSGMMAQSTRSSEDALREQRQRIKQNLGGGHFSKLDRI